MSDRSNGSYVGMRPAGPNTNTASGVWSLREAERRKRESQWPDGPPMPSVEASLLLHFDGSNGATSTTDSSPNNHAVTFEPEAVISTAQSKWGGSSLYIDGSWGNVSVPAGSAFAYGNGDFTIEAWVYRTADKTGVVYAQTSSGYNYVLLQCEAGGLVAYYGYDLEGGGGDPMYGPAGTLVGVNSWHHIAAVRSGGYVTVYCDGVGGTPNLNTTNYTNTTRTPTIGMYSHTYIQVFEGYIDDVRVKKEAVYTANFTPSAGPLT